MPVIDVRRGVGGTSNADRRPGRCGTGGCRRSGRHLSDRRDVRDIGHPAPGDAHRRVLDPVVRTVRSSHRDRPGRPGAADRPAARDPAAVRRSARPVGRRRDHRPTRNRRPQRTRSPPDWRGCSTQLPVDAPLRTVVVAGSVLPDRLADQALARGMTLIEYYGAAELSFVAARRYPAALRPFPGAEVEVRDGTVWVRSPYLSTGYPAGRGGPLRWDEEGFATVGDLADSDPGGGLLIRGRGDSAITTGGATVLAEDVERALAALPQVSEVAVVGVPHATPRRDRHRGDRTPPGGRSLRNPRGRPVTPERPLVAPSVVDRRPAAPDPEREDRPPPGGPGGGALGPRRIRRNVVPAGGSPGAAATTVGARDPSPVRPARPRADRRTSHRRRDRGSRLRRL